MMRSRIWSIGMATALAVFATIVGPATANAVPVGTTSFRNEGNSNGDFCASGAFDDVTFDVFGTPVNLGTDAGGVLCIGHFDAATGVSAHCVSTPDGSKFAFDATAPPSPGSGPTGLGVPQPFVGAALSASGTVAAAIGSATYTFDGVQAMQPDPANPQQPQFLAANDISGCPVVGPVSLFLGNVGINAFQTAPTNTGSNVAVNTTATYLDQATGMQRSAAVVITFANVTGDGATVVTATSSVAGHLSSNFSLNVGGLDPTFFDVSTTAAFDGPITICQHYDDADSDGFVDGTTVPETDLRILHGEGSPLEFVDRTSSLDTGNNIICAQTTSLSPFVIAAALDDPGFVPPNKANARCENAVARNVATLGKCIAKCQTKQADAALAGKSFDEEACEQGTGRPVSCRAAYDHASAVLLGKTPAICPACLGLTVMSTLADQLTALLENNNGQIYCAGTTGFGGDDLGLVPPDKGSAQCEDAVARNVGMLGKCIVTCHTKQADHALAGKSFNEEACQEGLGKPLSCLAKYDAASGKLLAKSPAICPLCLDAAAQRHLAKLMTTFLETNNGQIYCAGTIPLPVP